MALETYPHVIPDVWVVGGSTTAAGGAIAWAAGVLGYESVAEAFASASGSEAGSDGPPIFMPYLSGERAPLWRADARGAWLDLKPAHTRADLMGAVIDGVELSLRSILDRADTLLGRHDEVRVAKRDWSRDGWLQRRSAIYGRSIGVLNSTDPTSLGAMLLAAVGIGEFPDLQTAAANTVSVIGRVDPDPEKVKAYDRIFERFTRLKGGD
jgi:sugar (pentulose or hexulose) kinase